MKEKRVWLFFVLLIGFGCINNLMTFKSQAAEEGEIPISNKEILQSEGKSLGTLSNGIIYDNLENERYPIDYLKEQGIYKEENNVSQKDQEIQTRSINSTNIDLYVLDESYEKYLTIPSEYHQSYQLSVKNEGEVRYYVYKGDSVTVSSSGLIEPKQTVWYWNGNIGSTVSTGAEGEVVDIDYNYGSSVIRVVTNENTYDVTVTVHDYAKYHAEKVMDTFVTKNITSEMSEYEKMKIVAAFPCNFDYSAKWSGYTGMIVCGGGDCWASCSAILYLCDKIGLDAHLRYGANDSGAGSGHRNVAIKIGDKVYAVDAGYAGDAPRVYSVDEIELGFSFYYKTDDTVKITQYDGFESHITVPSQINGCKVTEIGENAFRYGEIYSGVNVKSVSLPNTLVKVGKQAFSNCEYIEKILLPASVEEIGDFAFTDCASLKEINVMNGNLRYASRNGVLFNKSFTELLIYPTAKTGVYTIPQGVERISKYSFYYTTGIHVLIVSEDVKDVGIGAFGDSLIKQVYFKGNIPKFGSYTFANLSVCAYYPKNNSSWNQLGTDSYSANQLEWNGWSSVSDFKAWGSGKNKVSLSWNKLDHAEGYLIYALKNGNYDYVTMTTGENIATDNNALDSDYNFYWIFPYVKDIDGKISVVPGMSSKYVYAKGICKSVQNLKASSVKGGVKLNWTASTDAEGYLIYGIVNGGKYGYVGMITKGTTFTDVKASSKVYNFYWVFPYHTDANGKMIVGGTPKYTYGRALKSS